MVCTRLYLLGKCDKQLFVARLQIYHEHCGHLCACQQSNPVFMLGQDTEELTQSSSTPKLSKPGKQGKHNYR